MFVLGFVSAKEESVVMLLCRHPCLQKNSLKEDWCVVCGVWGGVWCGVWVGCSVYVGVVSWCVLCMRVFVVSVICLPQFHCCYADIILYHH